MTLLAFAEVAETIPVWLLILGFSGQLIFGSRFFLQWLASERAGRSIIPNFFWWLSIAGSALLLTYFSFRRDPVGIVGQATGLLVYLRNLALIKRERNAAN